LALLVGCSDNSGAAKIPVYPVKGKVLLPDDKPLTSGSVEFVGAKGVMASVMGKLGSDGAFTLGSPETREGAPAGEYVVRIIPDSSSYVATNKGKAVDRQHLPYSPKYLDETSSGLTAVIKEGDNQLEPFRLTKAGAGDPKNVRDVRADRGSRD
jgi:hypothetical protein